MDKKQKENNSVRVSEKLFDPLRGPERPLERVDSEHDRLAVAARLPYFWQASGHASFRGS